MSIADNIRALAAEGVATAEIARRLGIRYQHAYNVLKRSSSPAGLSPSVVDPDGAAARDIARIAAEITKKGGLAHGVKAA